MVARIPMPGDQTSAATSSSSRAFTMGARFFGDSLIFWEDGRLEIWLSSPIDYPKPSSKSYLGFGSVSKETLEGRDCFGEFVLLCLLCPGNPADQTTLGWSFIHGARIPDPTKEQSWVFEKKQTIG